jgi:hypothetical protein
MPQCGSPTPVLAFTRQFLSLYPKKLNGECHFSSMGEPLVALESKPPLQPARFDSDDFTQI